MSADTAEILRRVAQPAPIEPEAACPPLAIAPADQRLARKLRRAELVSFDVFDTAILRPLADPTDLFLLMEGTVSRALGESLPNFPAARRHAEALARQRAWQHQRGREITLEEIYAVLCEVAGIEPDRAGSLALIEIEAEYAACRQNPFIHGIYRHCLSLGKRVAFLSDMYLPAAVVAEILHRNGYDSYEAVLVSSTAGQTKADGSLHREARALMQARRWLHIGDNYHSDIAMARKHRMAAWYYRRCMGELKRGYPARFPWRRGDPASASVPQGLVANRLACIRPKPAYGEDRAGFWFDFGYATTGPLLVGFTEWLIAQAAAQGLQALYFLSRDGLVMQRVYEALAPLSGPPLETHYLWASRRALNLAAITDFDDASLNFLVGASRTLEAKDYLDRVGLDWRDHVDAFGKAGFSSPHQIVSKQDDEISLKRLFTLLAEPVRERAREERSILIDYLSDRGMSDGRRVAVVDIGWRGSLQQSIADILEASGACPQITGLYLGSGLFLGQQKLHTPLFQPKYPHEAYLFRLGQPAAYADLIRTSVAVVELLFSAPEGSVIRIERDASGNFVPVRDQDTEDADRNNAIRWLQDGALTFVDDYALLKQQFPDLTVSREVAVAELERVLLHPNPVEARFIGDIRHDDTFGEVVRRPIARQPSWLRLLAGRRAFRRALRDVYWTQGRDAQVSRFGRAINRLLG